MSKLSELLAAAKVKAGIPVIQNPPPCERSERSELPALKLSIVQKSESESAQETKTDSEVHYGIGKNGESIQYNTEQWKFISDSISGKDAVLIGAAGTGKTTTMRGMIELLLKEKYFPALSEAHKYLPQGTVGIVACSFTRRAVANLKKAMPADLVSNCITIHKLLEYSPVYYEIQDEITGETKNTMRFEPTRSRYHPLDSAIKLIIVDESSMVSTELFSLLLDAIPDIKSVQFIFLGDIQQLPPVFGSAILGYKMVELSSSTTELIQVYRQALKSPIIRLAHRILSGNPIPQSEYPEWNYPNQLKIHPWKKRISSEAALLTTAAFFKQSYDARIYDPENHIILTPFNKACGTVELNKHIANHIARKNNLITYEVIAGFNKLYFSIGDKVLYDKEDAEIIAIKHNGLYSGKWPQKEAADLDYWGHRTESSAQEKEQAEQTEAEIDAMLNAMAASSIDTGEKVNKASHIITIRMRDSDLEIDLNTAADINSLLMAYALTVHKAQGSEWQKVFLILHQSHNTMIQRELLYTACTRAREELYVICEPDHFTKGIQTQRIKGNTLAEKATYFMGKIDTLQTAKES